MKNEKEEIVDVPYEVVPNEQGADASESNYRSTDHLPFPARVNPDEVAKLTGEEDPGKFMQGLAQLGLEIGSVISVKLKEAFIKKSASEGLELRPYERAKLSDIGKNTLTLEYYNKSGVQAYRYSDIEDIEILHKGQRIATHELIFPMYGVSEENMKPYLKQLTTGDETFVKTQRADGTELNAKLCVYRSKDEKKKGTAQMYAVYGAEKLEINDIPKLGIVFTDEMKKELLEKGELKNPYEGVFVDESTGREEKRQYKIVVDKELNVVRLQRIYKNQQKQQRVENVAVNKAVLIDLTKHLKSNGYGGAWTVTDSDENLKKGILLDRANGANAHIQFKKEGEKVVPYLNIYWGVDDNQGIGKDAYTKKFDNALKLVEEKMNGEKPAEKQSETKTAKNAEKQSEGKKTGPKLKA
jgi:hypothetical protein